MISWEKWCSVSRHTKFLNLCIRTVLITGEMLQLILDSYMLGIKSSLLCYELEGCSKNAITILPREDIINFPKNSKSGKGEKGKKDLLIWEKEGGKTEKDLDLRYACGILKQLCQANARVQMALRRLRPGQE